MISKKKKKKFKKKKKKKFFKKKEKKKKQQIQIRGRDGSGSGSGSGLGSRQGPAGPHPRGRRGTHISHHRHFQTLFLPPSSQWRSSSLSCCRRLCATFSCRSSALPSLKPCHLCTISVRCSSRWEHAFQILLCARTVPIYSALAAGKFFVFFVA